MRKGTFDTYKSTNLRLHNKLSQQDQYKSYLKRIQSIVDRKYKRDTSSQFYMTFLNKSREKARQQKSLEKELVIQMENNFLLQKIQKEKGRKLSTNTSLHQIRYFEKRIRDQEKINQQNRSMAQRILNQDSYLIRQKLFNVYCQPLSPQKRITKQRETQLKFYDSRVKNRKLPKIAHTQQVVKTSLLR